MSYLVISLILSGLCGFVGMLLLVGLNAPADNPFRVVWGTVAFWALVAVLGYFTTGWSSAIVSIGAGSLAFIVFNPSAILFTWGRALVQIGNVGIPGIAFFGWPFRRSGVLLQNLQVPLDRLLRRR